MSDHAAGDHVTTMTVEWRALADTGSNRRLVAWHGALLLMQDEWTALIDQPSRRAVPPSWHSDMQLMICGRDELVSQGRWTSGPPDVLGVLRKRRSELAHSDLLAWALDPSQAHGLGPALLRLLFTGVLDEQPPADLARARIRREVTREDTRADIVVELPNRSLVVENKINAGIGRDQPGRLEMHWPASTLIWLSPQGEVPLPTSDHATRWVALSYRMLHDLVGIAIQQSARPSTGVLDWHTSLDPRHL